MVATDRSHGTCSDYHAQPVCGEVLLGKFNMPMHIASIFIVLVMSALGVYLPAIAGWFIKDPNGSASVAHLDASSFGAQYGFWGNVFFLSRHFGTGVIISTAFVVSSLHPATGPYPSAHAGHTDHQHLLFHGMLMWGDKCLGKRDFLPVAPTIAMGAALFTFALDFVASLAAEKRFASSQTETGAASTTGESPDIGKAEKGHRAAHDGCCPDAEAAILAWQSKEVWRDLLLEAGIIFHS